MGDNFELENHAINVHAVWAMSLCERHNVMRSSKRKKKEEYKAYINSLINKITNWIITKRNMTMP